MEISFFNRYKGIKETEQVYGDWAINLLYGNSFSGKILTQLLAESHWFSRLYGEMQNSFFSKKKIKGFAQQYGIELDDFLPQQGRDEADPFANFNQFFIRRFKPAKRVFMQSPEWMPAFCEARYFGYESIDDSVSIPVKGKYLRPSSLLQNSSWAQTFEQGPMLIARLCPVDYHRFHYPDDGQVLERARAHGSLHSVNPLALKKAPDIFIKNERVINILETAHFGKIAYIEIGATCVGKIVQSHQGHEFKRGQEKGYFLFGGSTVIVIGQKGRWIPADDIIQNTQNHLETFVRLGDGLARVH